MTVPTAAELPGLCDHYTEGRDGSVYSPRIRELPVTRIGLLYSTEGPTQDLRLMVALLVVLKNREAVKLPSLDHGVTVELRFIPLRMPHTV